MRRVITLTILLGGGCTFTGAAGTDGFEDAAPVDAAAACTPAPDGILAWWDGEELGLDITGNTTSTVVGAPSIEPGHVGLAMKFENSENVSTEMLQVENAPASGQFTIEGWIYLERFHPQWLSIYGQMGDACFSLYNHSLTYWEADVGDGEAGNVAVQPMALGTAVWHHIAMTYDGSTLTTFANGTEVARQEDIVDVELPDSSAGLGGAPNGLTPVQDGWQGMLDELTIYERPLGPEEIAAIAAAGTFGKCKP